MKNLKIAAVILVALFFVSACQHPLRIACVGDSITEGVGSEVWNKSSYPMVLDSIMGANYIVMNCGRSAATMLKVSDMPYWKCNELTNVFLFHPDVITIKLGTNDSKDHIWNAANYKRDYQALIDTFRTISSKPKIYLCLPVPAFQHQWGINDTTIREQVIPIIQELAKENNLPVVNCYDKLKDQSVNFPDGIHPNEVAARKIAEVIADALKNENN